ncbi:MAG: hypothetical protein M1831_002417 [Alyxoria varia]|nr:MAG: hypothetical protein M1831_002417 [Alyxoria varia]
MPGRLPSGSDFPSSITLDIIPPPNPTGTSSITPSDPSSNTANIIPNILLLLHGHGSPAQTPFTNFARALNLPHTACLSIRARTPLPFDLHGYHWADDLLFDQDQDAPAADPNAGGVEKSMKMLVEEVIRGVLVGKCGFRAGEVQVFGFGAGGGVAMGCAQAFETATDEALGGVVNIGGTVPPLPSEYGKRSGKFKTPVLTLYGSSKSALTTTAAREVKNKFEDAEFHCWREKEGDGMPSSREEMLPIMRFWGRRLRAAAPEGAVEVG